MGEKKSFSVAQISKYRNILMGIGILDVLIYHFYSANSFTGLWAFVFGNITRCVHVSGFLFLSGFGLYYSYSKDNYAISFLKRRLLRVLVPYVLMVAVFMSIIMSLTSWNLGAFMGYITTLDYWNPLGYPTRFWYISLTVLLYVLFPMMYRFLFYKETGVIFRVIFLMAFFWGINVLVSILFPDYASRIYQALPEPTIFVAGIFFGFLAKRGESINLFVLFGTVGFVLIVCLLFKSKFPHFQELYFIIDKLITIPIICMILNYINMSHKKFYGYVNAFYSWFGKYTLELYIVHLLMWRIFEILFAESLSVSFVYISSVFTTILIAPGVKRTIGKVCHYGFENSFPKMTN